MLYMITSFVMVKKGKIGKHYEALIKSVFGMN